MALSVHKPPGVYHNIRIRPLDLPGHEPPLQGGLGFRAADPVPDIDKDPDPGLDLETNPGSARGPFSVVQVFIIILQVFIVLGVRVVDPVPNPERDPALNTYKDQTIDMYLYLDLDLDPAMDLNKIPDPDLNLKRSK